MCVRRITFFLICSEFWSFYRPTLICIRKLLHRDDWPAACTAHTHMPGCVHMWFCPVIGGADYKILGGATVPKQCTRGTVEMSAYFPGAVLGPDMWRNYSTAQMQGVTNACFGFACKHIVSTFECIRFCMRTRLPPPWERICLRLRMRSPQPMNVFA